MPESDTKKLHDEISELKNRISEYEKEFKSLHDDEMRFKALFENAPLGYQSLDIDGNFLEVNNKWLETLGYSRDEVIGKWFGDFIAPEYKEHFKKNFPRFKRIGAILGIEFEMIKKDGSEIIVSFNGKVGTDQDGNFKQTHCILQDITKNKQREESLQDNQALLQSIIHNVGSAIILMNSDHNVLEFNQEAENFFGLTRDRAIGKNFISDILPKGRRSEFNEKLSQVVDGNSVKNYINISGRENGKKRIISWNLDKLFDTENSIIGIVANGRDITEREKTMETMKKSEEKYRQLFDNMISGFALHEIITDKDGKPVDYIFLDLNEAFENLTGLKKENVIGTRIKEIMPDVEPGFIERYGKVALTGEPTQFEEYAGALNRYYQIKSYSPEKGKFAVIFDEITARKIAEQERQKLNMKLIEKNEELEQIIYVTSHDLRSPLVNIQGFGNELKHSVNEISDIMQKKEFHAELKEKIQSIVDEDILPSLKFISGSAAKMDSLLAGLLRLSRIGRTSLNVQNLDMNKLINEVINEFEYRIKESNVKIRIGDLPKCFGDELQINQVFSNLLDNSIKCIDPERPGEIEFSGRVENEYAVFCVTDNGIGMNKAHQKNIFEIFHRLDPDKNSGEGLGLTIVRKIIIRHNGKVEVESEQGKGSTFKVSLPVSTVKQKNREE